MLQFNLYFMLKGLLITVNVSSILVSLLAVTPEVIMSYILLTAPSYRDPFDFIVGDLVGNSRSYGILSLQYK